MKKQNKGEHMIQVLVFRDTSSGEADEVYRLDEAGEGDRFFANLVSNTEKNQVHHLRLEEWTEDQWKLAELSGDAFGEVLEGEREKQFNQLLAKVGSTPERVWPS